MFEVQKCKSCKTDIVWMKTAKNKFIPVNLNERVRVYLDFTEPRPLIFNHKTMESHFATCPFADSFRKQK